ncbi:MAG: arginine repressor [Sphaerochaetaceae bacterium]|jgi:transcriptional regulator of arginine metabolism|nr:arginine repressor [Sphaerochaetaceae bacterium]MDC7238496.1 arginine repressor [Sphaerochaetaceae bacterium]MDC7250661.1 arginine repressor [Sphaerochaetaceae bacterium]
MRERHTRLNLVKELIKNNRIDNQDTLLEMLKKEGYSVTQATLSRDLKMLKVGKISDGWSGYYYALPENDLISESEKSYIQDVRRGILSIEFSGNFGVIKTRSGHANSVAIALDVLAIPEILGTLAGDDTIFVILREGMSKEDLQESFKNRIPDIQE